MRFAKLNESPNFFDVPSNLPFSRNSNRLWNTKIQTTSLLEITVDTDCCLAKVEKIRIDVATSCKDREFSMPLREAPIKSIGLSFPQKASDFSWGTKSLKLSEIVFEILNLTDLFSIRLRKSSSTCNLLRRFIYFRSRVSTRSDFSKPDFSRDRSTDQLVLVRGSSLKDFMRTLSQQVKICFVLLCEA